MKAELSPIVHIMNGYGLPKLETKEQIDAMCRVMEEYANQKVIEELENWGEYFQKEYNDANILNRIKQLKQ